MHCFNNSTTVLAETGSIDWSFLCMGHSLGISDATSCSTFNKIRIIRIVGSQKYTPSTSNGTSTVTSSSIKSSATVDSLCLLQHVSRKV